MIDGKIFRAMPLVLVVAGCGNVDSAHLIFGQRQTVGLDISATAPEQGASLTLGYSDMNIAIIPVAVKGEDADDPNGDSYQRLGSTNEAAGGGDENDAYSTLGQFEMNTGENGTASVGLGKFFATGLAAQYLAKGFQTKLGK
jgi:hypothetical protein